MWIIGSKVVFIDEITVHYDETTERWARRSQACKQSADRRQITEIKRDAGADYIGIAARISADETLSVCEPLLSTTTAAAASTRGFLEWR